MTAVQLDLEVPTPPPPAGEPARCRMCRRELTDPTSRALGIGPECLAHLYPAPPGRVMGEWPPGPDDPVLPLGGGTRPTLHLVPLTRDVAQECVRRWHRHHDAPVGDLFRVGVADSAGALVAVGIAGRPVSRHLDDGVTVEVTRVASDGTRNAGSMLYGALTRAAFALGWRRVVTYTQAGETGASLRAAGWRVIAERPPRRGWDTPSRPRDDAAYAPTARTLWEAGEPP